MSMSVEITPSKECTWCGHTDCGCQSLGQPWMPWRCDCPDVEPEPPEFPVYYDAQGNEHGEF